MRIIDSMDAIRPIMSRLSMLAPFDDHGIHLKVVTCIHPRESLLSVLHSILYCHCLQSPLQLVHPMSGSISCAEASWRR